MTISVMSAAKTACEHSGWTLTNLSLQKLLYLAHMKFLGQASGEPLLKEAFEAWKYGPVVSRLYQEVKKFGDAPIADMFLVDRNLRRLEHAMIKEIVDAYGNVSPGHLVELTHRSGGAWAEFYQPQVEHIAIPNSAILREYRRFPF